MATMGVQAMVVGELPATNRLRHGQHSPGKNATGRSRSAAVLRMALNRLDDEAMRTLLLTLKQARVVIGISKFYQNRLGCQSAKLLSQWIRSAPFPFFELHLSNNRIRTAGALELIKAVAETNRYPSARPGSKWPLPLWLRLEHNDIPEADSFEQKAELCLQAARPHTKGKLICWFTPRNGYGPYVCKSDNCRHSTLSHCPVIHMPHLRLNRRKGTFNSSGSVAASASSGAKLLELQNHLAVSATPEFTGDFRTMPRSAWTRIYARFLVCEAVD